MWENKDGHKFFCLHESVAKCLFKDEGINWIKLNWMWFLIERKELIVGLVKN